MYLDKVHLKHQRRARRNRSRGTIAISERGRDVQGGLAALTQQLYAILKPFDYAEKRQIHRLIAVERAIENRSVNKLAGIVERDGILVGRMFVISRDLDFVV
jgi:hypothetical protein